MGRPGVRTAGLRPASAAELSHGLWSAGLRAGRTAELSYALRATSWVLRFPTRLRRPADGSPSRLARPADPCAGLGWTALRPCVARAPEPDEAVCANRSRR